ncbi:MAG: hypothetical protein Q8M73_03440 [Actinomycetota bacterium]|nr:hypothetical protein [Actinomycetota bacterium]
MATPQGTVIGTYSSVHTVLSVCANGPYEILNTTTYELPKGTILTGGNEVWMSNVAAQSPTVQIMPITGGTGLNAGVSGTSTNVPNPWPIDVLFTFTNK